MCGSKVTATLFVLVFASPGDPRKSMPNSGDRSVIPTSAGLADAAPHSLPVETEAVFQTRDAASWAYPADFVCAMLTCGRGLAATFHTMK